MTSPAEPRAPLTPIPAAQLLYTTVEEDESPQRKRGFQTVNHTSELLTEAEVREIEPRLIYPAMNARADRPAIWTFFKLQTGKLVLAQITPIADTDKHGRPKTLFAHALAFTPPEFRRLDNNPFTVFDRFEFLTSLENARGQGAERTGHIPHVDFEPVAAEAPAPLSFLADMEPAQVKSLIQLALASHRPAAERLLLACCGKTDAMRSLLRDVFRVLPVERRTDLSFDTLFAGDNGLPKTPQSPFWAVGLVAGQSLRQTNLYHFDLNTRRFAAAPALSLETMVGKWLDLIFKSPAWQEALLSLGALHDLEACFHGKEVETGSPAVPDREYRQFLEANVEELKRIVAARLALQVGRDLAKTLFADTWRDALTGRAMLSVARKGTEPVVLTERLVQLCDHAPGEQELGDVQAFLDKYRARPDCRAELETLRLRSSRWARDWDELVELLPRVSADAFRAFGSWSLRSRSVAWSPDTVIDGGRVLVGPCLTIDPRQREQQRLLLALFGIAVRERRGEGDGPSVLEVGCQFKMSERWSRWPLALEAVPADPARGALAAAPSADGVDETNPGVPHDIWTALHQRPEEVRNSMARFLGPLLTTRCVTWAQHQQPAAPRPPQRQEGEGLRRLAIWLKEVLYEAWPGLEQHEVGELATFLRTHWGEPVLAELRSPLVAFYDVSTRRWEDLTKALGSLSEGEFTRFAGWALQRSSARVECAVHVADGAIVWGPAIALDDERGSHALGLALLGAVEEVEKGFWGKKTRRMQVLPQGTARWPLVWRLWGQALAPERTA